MRYTLVYTDVFKKWLSGMKNREAVKAVLLRLSRVEAGNLGDCKPIGEGVSEMRIFVGKGYRLYFTVRNDRLVILLCGGDKISQRRDIRQAKALLKEVGDEY